jgi:hypothetical protein
MVNKAKGVFRGHNFIWGSYNPGWLTSGRFNATSDFSLIITLLLAVVPFSFFRCYCCCYFTYFLFYFIDLVLLFISFACSLHTLCSFLCLFLEDVVNFLLISLYLVSLLKMLSFLLISLYLVQLGLIILICPKWTCAGYTRAHWRARVPLQWIFTYLLGCGSCLFCFALCDFMISVLIYFLNILHSNNFQSGH